MKKNEKSKNKIYPNLFRKSMILDSKILKNLSSILMNNNLKQEDENSDNLNFQNLENFFKKIEKINKKDESKSFKNNDKIKILCKILKSINNERITFRNIVKNFLENKFYKFKESLKIQDLIFNKISGINENIKQNRIENLEKNIFLLKEKLENLQIIILEKNQNIKNLEEKLLDLNQYLKHHILKKKLHEENYFFPNLKKEEKSIFSLNISDININEIKKKNSNNRKTKIKRKCSIYSNQNNNIKISEKNENIKNFKNRVFSTTCKKKTEKVLKSSFTIKPFRFGKLNSFFEDNK